MSDHDQANNIEAIKEAEQDVQETAAEIADKLQLMEKFIARRFDELSMEINATAQQFDLAEDSITGRFAEILEILGAISYQGSGDSAANTGVELEAVIEDTEDAANKILDAADRIAETIEDNMDWNDPASREKIRDKISADVQEILLACTFQDLTGQRIRNTLNNLHNIESRLSSTFERLGIDVQVSDKDVEKNIQRVSSQAEIDALIKGLDTDKSSAEPANTAVSQDDVDALFSNEGKR